MSERGEVKVLGMALDSEFLCDRVALALEAADIQRNRGGARYALTFWQERAAEALAALGLDDLDAAVERAASALALRAGYNANNVDPKFWASVAADYRDRAGTALEAALTATPESEVPDA